MNRETLRAILGRDRWFAGLEPALQEAILRLGRVRRYAQRPIYSAGDPPNGLFALLSGEVRITRVTPSGRLALLMVGSPATWFGESSMLDGEARFSTAIAVGEAVVLQLSPSAFRTITGSDRSYYAAFVQIVCRRHRQAIDYIVDTSALPLPVRLAQRLLELSDTGGGDMEIRLSQHDLAAAVGTSRQTLNKALKALEHDGVIRIGYGSVSVLATRALERLARAGAPLT